jgi:hypothetical protein
MSALVQQVDVFRIPCRGPGDLGALQLLVDQGQFDPRHIVAVMGKTEGNGCVNDLTRDFASVSLLNDSDINATRHARAAVGGVLASLTGYTELYVSGGAEHQGPAGGGPVAAIVRVA